MSEFMEDLLFSPVFFSACISMAVLPFIVTSARRTWIAYAERRCGDLHDWMSELRMELDPLLFHVFCLVTIVAMAVALTVLS